MRRRVPLDEPEARVVARALVFLAWVAQADHEADHGGLLLLFLLFFLALVALVASGLVRPLLRGGARRGLAFLRRRRLLGGRHLRRRHCGGGRRGLFFLGDER